MKQTTKLLLFLTIICSFLLSACGGQSAATPPNGDDLVKFDKNGVAVLQGQLSGGSLDTPGDGSRKEILRCFIPVKVERIKTALEIAFTVRPETELSSSLTPKTTSRDYNSFHANSGIYHAFPPGALLQVAFRKTGAEFEAVSFQEVTKKPFFQKWATIDHVFSTDVFSQGTVKGNFTQALNKNDGTKMWKTAIPIPVQGIETVLILEIQSTPNTLVVTPNGTVSASSEFSWGDGVQIKFTRKGDTLIADQITVVP